MTDQIKSVAGHFALQGALLAAKELTSGNINKTYRLTCEAEGAQRDYVLQRINTYVFKRPMDVMENILRVTEYLRGVLTAAGEDPARRVLRVIPTLDGQCMYTDPEGGCWRAYDFIPDAAAYNTVDAATFYQVGRGFGEFQRLLAGFPAEQLHETIPQFHDTRARYRQLEAAMEANSAGRRASVQQEIGFLLARRERLCSVAERVDRGELPLRVTHNDTKSNNVMVDAATGAPLCVIDLDTVMPGSVLYDYGDAIRFAGTTAPEDEPDVTKIALDMEKTRAFTRGFIQETNGFLTREELRLLPLGIEIMTGELAVRFLTDYLAGDPYFKLNYPEHNLVRTRAQIALLQDVERKAGQLQAMVDELIGK